MAVPYDLSEGIGMNNVDVDQEFLKQRFHSTGQMFSYLTRSYGSSPGRPVHLIVMLPTKNVTVEKVEETAKNRGLLFKADPISDTLYRVTLGVKVRRVEGFLIAEDDWWLLISRGKGSSIHSVVVRSFIQNHFFPLIHPAYIDSREMTEILTDLMPLYNRLVLEEFSMASERSSLREWLKSRESFDVNLANDLQRKYNSSFTAFRVKGISEEIRPARFRIYTESRLCFLSGSFGDFFEFVVVPFIHKSLQMDKRYQNRERRVEDGKIRLFGVRIKGLNEFSKEDLASIRSFVQKQYSTVLIYENPLVALQASDYRDGSSFDIYLTESGIEIVPLTKSSSASLVELCTSMVRRLPPFASFEPIPPIEAVYG